MTAWLLGVAGNLVAAGITLVPGLVWHLRRRERQHRHLHDEVVGLLRELLDR